MISDILFSGNSITIVLAFLLLGIVALLIFIFNLIGGIIHRLRHKEAKRVSPARNGVIFALLILWIFLCAAGLLLIAFTQPYQIFTKKELAAIVRCTPLGNESGEMRMRLTLVKNGKLGDNREFRLKGDQWAIEGNILKWDDWLSFLGLSTMYELTRVRGRYVNTIEEVQHTPTVYSLVENEDNPKWRWLYKYGYNLPFVSAVYGNTVFTYPSEENTYEIYVTSSGFTVQVREK